MLLTNDTTRNVVSKYLLDPPRIDHKLYEVASWWNFYPEPTALGVKVSPGMMPDPLYKK